MIWKGRSILLLTFNGRKYQCFCTGRKSVFGLYMERWLNNCCVKRRTCQPSTRTAYALLQFLFILWSKTYSGFLCILNILIIYLIYSLISKHSIAPFLSYATLGLFPALSMHRHLGVILDPVSSEIHDNRSAHAHMMRITDISSKISSTTKVNVCNKRTKKVKRF